MENQSQNAHIILVRHGERADRKDKDNCINDDDTNLTQKGIEDSILTGGNIILRLQENNILDNLNTMRFVSSPWHRCIETTQGIIQGMIAKLEEIGESQYIEIIKAQPYYLEEAFMERIKGRTAERVLKHQIFCDPEFPNNHFPNIEFIKNSLIDYETQEDHLTHKTTFEERPHIFRANFNAFSCLVEKIQSEHFKYNYLVVSHGMTVESASIFAKVDEMTAPIKAAPAKDGEVKKRPKFKKCPFNATSIWEISDFKRKSCPTDIDVVWDITSRFILKLSECAKPHEPEPATKEGDN